MCAPIRELFSFGSMIRRFIVAWLFAVTLEYMMLPNELKNLYNPKGLRTMSFERILAVTIVGVVLLTFVYSIFRTSVPEKLILSAVFLTLSVAVLCVSYSWQLYTALVVICVIIAVYAMKELPKINENYSIYGKITVAATIVFFLIITALSVFRYLNFGSPTYDFGIFAQMFYNMKETGRQLTTLERDGLLSHFSVHISPIYYIILPIYMLFPFPVTLLIIQSAVMASSVIPLQKLCKSNGLSELKSMAVAVLLLLYPAFSGGAAYDFHENCFLTPLILWLFLGIEKKSIPLILISLLLLLSVKEDAAVYSAVIGLWVAVSGGLDRTGERRRRIITGSTILLVSVLYFIIAFWYLSSFGEGVMTGRYNNFIYDGSGSLITVIKAVIMNPIKLIAECTESDKLGYIAVTLIPVLGLPFITKKYERYILLIPYILVNLMPDYIYQHDIFFQYSFGSTAFIFYLVILNLSDMKADVKSVKLLITMTLVSVIAFSSLIATVAVKRTTDYFKNYTKHTEIYGVLSEIPKDSAVAATTFYTSVLSQRETVYDIWYSGKEHILGCEYIVINAGAVNEFGKFETETEDGYTGLTDFLSDNGYQKIYSYQSSLEIYKNDRF